MDQDRTQIPDWAQLFESALSIEPDNDLQKSTRAIPAGGGICLLADRDNQPVQLLTAGDLRRLVRSRLSDQPEQEPSRKLKLRSIVRKIFFRRCHSAFETQLLYFRSVRTIFPDNWQNCLPGMEAWFIEVDFNASLPVFKRSRSCHPDSACKSWGPLATGRSVSMLLEVLQSAYRLCRHPERLSETPYVTGCPYAQMGQCAAVCNGTVSLDQYRQLTERAAGLLNEGPEQTINTLAAEVKCLSAALEFEKAALLHRQMEQLKKLKGPAYRWLMPMERFLILSFQTGPMQKVDGLRALQPSIIPFIITGRQVIQLLPFTRNDIESNCQSLLDHVNLIALQHSAGRGNEFEKSQLAWITQMLYRKKQAKELFIRATDTLTLADLVRQIESFFDSAIQPSIDKSC